MNRSQSSGQQDFTIAITVYDRRDYIFQAIESALNQTIPAKVIVLEDCGPDTGLRDFVQKSFGEKIGYFRNPQRRGLFDNWNACIELCTTPFLSILHDDDFLHPNFLAAMLDLMNKFPGRGLYFGRTNTVDENGKLLSSGYPPMEQESRSVALRDFALNNALMFPGQLMNLESAKAVGGFRKTSLYCGDYEMWAKLTARFGAAQTSQIVSSIRTHRDWTRGTSQVERSGKISGLIFIQQKRIAAMLKHSESPWKFDRRQLLNGYQFSAKYLIRNAKFFSPRILKYNYMLLMDSQSRDFFHLAFKTLAKVLGPGFLRWISRIYGRTLNRRRLLRD
jgi:glycosyltransferase involved in cell wall biosynthesis